jgi:MFS family permease
MSNQKLHYGWAILIISSLVVGSALGIGRFSYGMLLPSMQEGMGLTHQEAGVIASANMLGYCLATLVVGGIVFKVGSRKIIFLSLSGVGLSMIAVGLSGGFISASLLRFITGVCSAGANITVMGLSSAWFSRNRRGIANGFLVGGSGVAMLFTGRLVPMLIERYPEEGWRFGWLLLGAIVIAIGFLAWIVIRNHPQEKRLLPLGDTGSALSEKTPGERVYAFREIIYLKKIQMVAFTYFCFGMSYIIFTTFLVNFLMGEKGITQTMAGDIWSLIGFLSIGSAVIWGSLSDKIGRPTALTIVFFLQGLNYMLLAATTREGIIWSSAIIFGLTAWSIPGIMASYCGDLLGPKNATSSLGFVTLLFSVGSILGPISAGYIKDISGSFSGAFYLAAMLALLGGMLSFAQIKNKPWLQHFFMRNVGCQ